MINTYSLSGFIFLGWNILLSLASADIKVETWIDFRQGEIRTAMDEASSQGKLVFVDVYATWCLSCKLMDESTFKSPKVIDLMNDYFIPVKIDVETLEGKLFAAQENVETLPAIILMDAEGNRLEKVDHALNSTQMIDMLNRHLSSDKRQRK